MNGLEKLKGEIILKNISIQFLKGERMNFYTFTKQHYVVFVMKFPRSLYTLYLISKLLSSKGYSNFGFNITPCHLPSCHKIVSE